MHEHLRVEIGRSQVILEETPNGLQLPASYIQDGSPVWLDGRHILTTRPPENMD